VPTRDENDTIKACLVELQQDLRPRLAQLHFTGGAKKFVSAPQAALLVELKLW
jgi:hypothetical protein